MGYNSYLIGFESEKIEHIVIPHLIQKYSENPKSHAILKSLNRNFTTSSSDVAVSSAQEDKRLLEKLRETFEDELLKESSKFMLLLGRLYPYSLYFRFEYSFLYYVFIKLEIGSRFWTRDSMSGITGWIDSVEVYEVLKDLNRSTIRAEFAKDVYGDRTIDIILRFFELCGKRNLGILAGLSLNICTQPHAETFKIYELEPISPLYEQWASFKTIFVDQ